MIKPQSLLYACRAYTDSKEIGDIVRKLAGQDDVELSPSQEITYKMILMDDKSFEKNIEKQREEWRKNKAAERERKKAAEEAARKAEGKSGTGAATVTPSAAGAAVSAHAGAAGTVTPVAVIAPPSVDGRTVDWSKVDISDDGMFDEGDPILKACKVTGEYNNKAGRGYWRRWIREYPPNENGERNGEFEFRQALFDAMRELRAGEDLGRNPPAVFNDRLQERFDPKKKQGGEA